jgi:hypothetical protein
MDVELRGEDPLAFQARGGEKESVAAGKPTMPLRIERIDRESANSRGAA